MNNGKNLDREGASTSTPRRVEKVGEAQLIEDSAGRLTPRDRRQGRGRQQLREPHDQPDLSGTGHRGCHP